MRAASTRIPASVIHSLVTSRTPSSSLMRSILVVARPHRTSAIKTSAGMFWDARMASVQTPGWAALSPTRGDGQAEGCAACLMV
jgi:hypothetical protein